MDNPFRKFLKKNGFDRFDLKAVLFDMDGVLYDSMKFHSDSWYQTATEFGLDSTPEEFYMHEGRVGRETIEILIQRNLGRTATEDEIKGIYKRKTELFNSINKKETIPFAYDVLKIVKKNGLQPVLVTGSGQKSLLEGLDINFPGIFRKDMMVTAHDVKNGKPNPEPYLMGLKKAGNLMPNQAFVIENAPMGIEAAFAAGIFTIAVNTGPLADEILWESGADIVLPSMKELADRFDDYIKEIES